MAIVNVSSLPLLCHPLHLFGRVCVLMALSSLALGNERPWMNWIWVPSSFYKRRLHFPCHLSERKLCIFLLLLLFWVQFGQQDFSPASDPEIATSSRLRSCDSNREKSWGCFLSLSLLFPLQCTVDNCQREWNCLTAFILRNLQFILYRVQFFKNLTLNH